VSSAVIPVRLTAVLTHPVQYYTPWFQYITGNCPEIELTVLYATEPTAEQQGAGFGRAFTWDLPLTAGHRHRVLRPARPGDRLESDSFRGVDVPEVGAAVLASDPDVVLIPGWHSITQRRALRACRRAGIPVLYRGDSTLAGGPRGWRRPLWRRRTRWLLSRYAGYLAVGTRSREYLRAFGAADGEIFASPHCVDNERFASQAAPWQTPHGRAEARAAFGLPADPAQLGKGGVILFAGKLEPRKRPLDLVRAVAILGPGHHLLMVGDGPLAAACREEARRLGVAASWPGFLNQSELGRAHGAADCLALPSGSETWGLAVNEALAAGLPCVVSDQVGCAPDLVTPGVTGEVYPAGDVAALAAALARVLAAARNMADACRARAAEFSFAAATAGLAAACRAVAQPMHATSGAPPAALEGAEPMRSTKTAKPIRVIACCGGMVIVSGTERMTFEVLGALAADGAAIHCIVNSWENHRIVPLAAAVGATWSTAPYLIPIGRAALTPRGLVRLTGDVRAICGELLRQARRVRPTHVFCPEFTSVLRNGPVLALLRLRGVRVVLRLGNAPTPGVAYRRLWRWAVAPLCDVMVANSDFTLRELLAHGVPERKTRRIFNTVPERAAIAGAEIPAPVRDPRKVLYVGQVIPDKGVHLLLEAVARLRAAGTDVRLDVAGTMEGWTTPAERGYRESLVARAAAPDLAGHVRFLGQRDDVPALFAAAGVHACPSLPAMREGFGLVVIEAKRAGCPSVVLPSGALPELIAHGVDGWICPDATHEALAAGLDYFLGDPARRDRAGRAAQASLDRFTHERFADAWRQVFGRPATSGEAAE
jgi:glycosyltransferase involved in cell wall biosynthesis